MTAVNPFVWDRPLTDPASVVGMDEFAQKVALALKGKTNVRLFGPRGTGKTTFCILLEDELRQKHGPKVPPFETVRINLEQAYSLTAFIACVHEALTTHSDTKIRRVAQSKFKLLEAELGVDIRLFKAKAAWKRGGTTTLDPSEALHAVLRMLAGVADRLVVVFDEFQRLRDCPGHPLATIRSALMDPVSNHVSILFTGSARRALDLMLENSYEPIFQQATPMEIPAISWEAFCTFIESSFQTTSKQITDEGINYLLTVTNCHPKRTQQLAWRVWADTSPGQSADLEAVQAAFDALINNSEADFAKQEDFLASELAGSNERRALRLLADHDGDTIFASDKLEMYGLSTHATLRRALERLVQRGFVCKSERGQEWQIIDPFLREWLRRSSPLM